MLKIRSNDWVAYKVVTGESDAKVWIPVGCTVGGKIVKTGQKMKWDSTNSTRSVQ